MRQEQASGNVPTFEMRHRLALALEAADVSNEQMADEVGKSVTTIRNYLSGRTHPGRAVVVTWALRCGVPFDWLAYGIEADDPRDPSEQVKQSFPWDYDEPRFVLKSVA
jgi:transcriptional regulator with XRE-family HTH domain